MLPMLILSLYAPIPCLTNTGQSGYLLYMVSKISSNQITERTIACVEGNIDEFQYFELIDIKEAQPQYNCPSIPPEERFIHPECRKIIKGEK